MMQRIIPKIFYSRMEDGFDLFVKCLGFKVVYQDESLSVVEREGVKAYLVEDATSAAKDRPELTIETDAIDALYDEIRTATPQMLHPNGNGIQNKSWGSREFAVLDKTDVCVVFRQW